MTIFIIQYFSIFRPSRHFLPTEYVNLWLNSFIFYTLTVQIDETFFLHPKIKSPDLFRCSRTGIKNFLILPILLHFAGGKIHKTISIVLQHLLTFGKFMILFVM